MKILYAVQATGNGHISRAMELIPYIQQHGSVDIFLSGDNANLDMDAEVKYRSKGVSLYYNSTGGLDYWKIAKGIHPLSLRKEINELPVEKYDLVINDYEFITSAACAKKNIPSIQVGHQASFQSKLTPRPSRKNIIGEWVLKNYAKASHYIGLHFDRYDDFILPPVIKQDILDADPVNKGHITVYLPSFSAAQLEKLFKPFSETELQVFSKEIKQKIKKGNLYFFPVSKSLFNESMITSSGVFCGAGFETPAEALYLQKKLLCFPTRGQYEQLCNAAALEKMGVPCISKIDETFSVVFNLWLESAAIAPVKYGHSIPRLVDRILMTHEKMQSHPVGEATWQLGDLTPAQY